MDNEIKRDDFSNKTKDILKQRAGYICSNPSCRRMTIAPSAENNETVQYIGVCAHISAANSGGPRYEKELSVEERSSIQNGNFLCASCSVLIDKNNGKEYSIQTLNTWKNNHEEWTRQNLNKAIQQQFGLSNNNQTGGIFANIVHVNNNYIQTNESNESPAILHDKELFYKAEAILSEEEIWDINGELRGNESIKIDVSFRISKILDFYRKSANEYIQEKIEIEKKRYFISLGKLYFFIDANFDKWPYNQGLDNFQICLSPMTNSDRSGRLDDESFRKHSVLRKELLSLINKVEKDYSNFRRAVKGMMFI